MMWVKGERLTGVFQGWAESAGKVIMVDVETVDEWNSMCEACNG